MHWKKAIAVAALLVAGLILAAFILVAAYDFNTLKPRIQQLAKETTGRELVIAGDLDVRLGFSPVISIHDVRFQNAPWGSRPDLLTATRIELRVKLWPLILGDLVFKRIHLIEPDFLLEFNKSGDVNLLFDTIQAAASQERPPDLSTLPVFIVKDLTIEKGRFNYIDEKRNLTLEIRIDSANANIRGWDKPVRLKASGAVEDIPLTVKGNFGPIWAWLDPNLALSADLSLTSGGTSATVRGSVRDPIEFESFSFDIVSSGSSTKEIARYAEQPKVPEFGPFTITARVSDADGKPALHILNAAVGEEERVRLAVTGKINDVISMRGVALDVTATGQDTANLVKIGIPPIPLRGPFRITAGLSDPKPKIYKADDMRVAIGDHLITGRMELSMAEPIPMLTAKLSSEKFGLWPFTLDAVLTGPVDKLALPKLDVIFGTEDVVKASLRGSIGNLLKLSGVDLDFQMRGRDLSNASRIFNRKLPLRGAFHASGKAAITEPKLFQVPKLQVSLGKNDFEGSMDWDLRGEAPQWKATLSSRDLDASSIIPKQSVGQPWVKALDQMDPFEMRFHMTGFSGERSIDMFELSSGNSRFLKLEMSGTIQKVKSLQGIDLTFHASGQDVGQLGQLYGGALPAQGIFDVSGRIAKPEASTYEIADLGILLGPNELSGRVNIDLAGNQPRLFVELSSRQISLESLSLPDKKWITPISKITDFGPLALKAQLSGPLDRITLERVDLDMGREELAKISLKGALNDLSAGRGLDVQFSIKGNDAARLEQLLGQPVPLEGVYKLSGRLSDPAVKTYRIEDLNAIIGENDLRGRVDLVLAKSSPMIALELESSKTTLAPVTIESIESLRGIPDLGPLKLAVRVVGRGDTYTFTDLDLNFGKDELVSVMVKGTIKDPSIPKGMNLDFAIRSSDLAIFEKLSGKAFFPQGALRLSGHFVDIAPNVYRTSSLTAIWGESEHKGWVELDLSGERPKVRADISSNKLDLRPVLAREDSKETATAPPPSPGTSSARVFSSKAWNLEGLSRLDADLHLRNQQVLLPRAVIGDVEMYLHLDEGHLRITPFTFRIGEGSADILFDLNSREAMPVWKTAIHVEQLSLGAKLDQLESRANLEGKLDMDVRLDGSGDSMAALMAGLNGDIRAAIKDGRIVSRYLAFLQRYMGDLLQLFNPSQVRAEYTPINCWVNNINIKDGLADVKVLLDTDQTTLISAGGINLKTEKLNLSIKPTPKRSSGVGVTISFRRMSQWVRLGGTLADPDLVFAAGNTFRMFGRIAGGFLIAGPFGSAAAFFADVSVGKEDACQIADEVYEYTGQPEAATEINETPGVAGNDREQPEHRGPSR
ncbi:hypothetical protein D3OALGB2SA_2316 [Olavius algarvensis associated proteobacterium Delta 3]|nr:hypothetical protein D3OALGB2SA_2316 [Olavius algarvensis associated proteobacterium Delta 3]